MSTPNRILAKNLYKAVKAVKRTEIHSMPIINTVRLSFEEGQCKVTTVELTDSGFKAATETAPSIMNSEWAACLTMVHKVEVHPNGRYKGTKQKFYPFLDYLKIMAEYDEVLEMDFDPTIQTVTIKAGSSRSTFKCIDAQEFPPV